MFTCHRCSRVFHRDPPADALLPPHRDALLGLPCESARAPILGVLDLDPLRDDDNGADDAVLRGWCDEPGLSPEGPPAAPRP